MASKTPTTTGKSTTDRTTIKPRVPPVPYDFPPRARSNGQWEIQIKGENGKWEWRNFGKLSDPKAALEKYRATLKPASAPKRQ